MAQREVDMAILNWEDKDLTMKSLMILFFAMLLAGELKAQQQFVVPQLDASQKIEVLYSHAIAYNLAGISYAKSRGDSPQKYGEFVGTLFKPFWNPDEGFQAFANGLMYILAGFYPDNEMQIIYQDKKTLHIKLKNVDLSFRSGPAYGITYDEFLGCAYGIISVLAEHMNVEFSQKISDGWYEVKLIEK